MMEKYVRIIMEELTSWNIIRAWYESFPESIPNFQLIFAAGRWSTARSCPNAAIWKVLIKLNRFDNAPVFVFPAGVNWFWSRFFTWLFIRFWRFFRLWWRRSNSCTVPIFYEFYHFSEWVFSLFFKFKLCRKIAEIHAISRLGAWARCAMPG